MANHIYILYVYLCIFIVYFFLGRLNFRGVTFHIFFWVGILKLARFSKLVLVYCILGSCIGNPTLQDKLFIAPFFVGCARWSMTLRRYCIWNAVGGEREKGNMVTPVTPSKHGNYCNMSAFKGTFDHDFPGVGFSSSLKGNIFNFQSNNKSFRQFLVTSPGLSLGVSVRWFLWRRRPCGWWLHEIHEGNSIISSKLICDHF